MTDISKELGITMNMHQSGAPVSVEGDEQGIRRMRLQMLEETQAMGPGGYRDIYALSEAAEAPVTEAEVGGTMAGFGPGRVAGLVGAPGDIAALATGLYKAAFPDADQGRLDAFITQVEEVSNKFGSGATLGFLDDMATQAGVPEDVKQGFMQGAEVGSFFGFGQGAKATGKGVAAAGKAYAEGAPARVAERQQGVTLGAGIDPTAPIDEAIIGAQKALQKPTKQNPITAVAPTETEPGIIAFHGSGADFDEFSVNKIGTGEGAQAYGYGLYFTDSEDIAKFYRDAVQFNQAMRGTTQIKYKGKVFEDLGDTAAAETAPPSYNAIKNIAEEMNKLTGTFGKQTGPKVSPAQAAKDRVLKRLDAEIKKYSKAGQADSDVGSIELQGGDTLEELIVNDLQQQKQAVLNINADDIEIATGKIYKVGLAPKPDELLDYELTIGNQSPDIKTKISELIDNEITPDDLENFGSPRGDLKASLLSENRTVVSFLNDFAAIRGKDNAGEELLAKYGIPGIKYFDNAARNTAGGKLIDVTEAKDGFRAKVAVDNRPGGLGGSGRIVTTSPPYKTKQEALDWADEKTKMSDRNYVIFDDKMIKILEKYGIVGPVAITALGAAKQEGDQNASGT